MGWPNTRIIIERTVPVNEPLAKPGSPGGPGGSEPVIESPPGSTAEAPSFASQQPKARELAATIAGRGEEVVVNIGGAGAPHEPQGAINVNNQAVARKDIPNLIQTDGSRVGELFAPSSVDRIEGHNIWPPVPLIGSKRRPAPTEFSTPVGGSSTTTGDQTPTRRRPRRRLDKRALESRTSVMSSSSLRSPATNH